jgi:hypothetical protein
VTAPPETTTTMPPAPTTTTTIDTTAGTDDPASELTDPADTNSSDQRDDGLDRADLVVDIANGANRAGLATETATALGTLGYVNVQAANTALAGTSTVYFAQGFEREASRLALDIGLPASAIVPIDGAPPIEPNRLVQLIVVLGTDQL